MAVQQQNIDCCLCTTRMLWLVWGRKGDKREGKGAEDREEGGGGKKGLKKRGKRGKEGERGGLGKQGKTDGGGWSERAK